MNFRRLQWIVLATALGGAMGVASAQQGAAGAIGSGGTTPAAAKTSTDVQGNAALTSDVAISGSPRPGSSGTQSGVTVTDTASMGAGAWSGAPSGQSVSSARSRALARYNALR
jgi:hypothetical protein